MWVLTLVILFEGESRRWGEREMKNWACHVIECKILYQNSHFKNNCLTNEKIDSEPFNWSEIIDNLFSKDVYVHSGCLCDGISELS